MMEAVMRPIVPPPLEVSRPAPKPEIGQVKPGVKEQASKLWGKVRNWLPFWKTEVRDQPEKVVKQMAKVDTDLPEEPDRGIQNINQAGKVKVPEENTDLTEKTEELFVEGLPDGSKITTALSPDRQHEMNEFRWVVKSRNWDLKAVDYNGEFWMSMKPRVVEGVENIDKGRYLDTRIAYVDGNGNLQAKPESGYKIISPGDIKREEGIIFRGLSREEMDNMITSGRIQSRGDVVKDIGAHVGLTFYSKDPGQSLGYATAQRIPGYRSPTFDRPNYLIAVKDPGNHIVEGDAEIGIGVAVPTDQIVSIFEVRPVLIIEGEIPLQVANKVAPGEGLRLYSHAPKIEVALKTINFDNLRMQAGKV